MKSTIFTAVLSCSFFGGWGQNIILNPGFEDTTSCPVFLSEITKSPPWFNPSSSASTPDYYNSCNTNANGPGVPWNFPGYQLPRTGNAYAGFFAFQTLGEYREYIEAKLNKPLVAGKRYDVEFYVVLSNNLSGTYAISTIGAYFSANKITSTNDFALPCSPQVESPRGTFLTDSLNWMRVNGSFQALGGEAYITIGNFNNDANTDTLRIFSDQWGAAYGSYYYIDDISVIQTPENNIFLPNAFSPNGDNKNDLLKVRGQNVGEAHLLVFNRWGEKVFESLDQNLGWDGTFNNGACPTDVYFYYLTGIYTDGAPFEQKGNVTLMR